MKILVYNKKGYWYFGVGSLFMVLVVGFVAVNMISPDAGGAIVSSLASLFGAVRG